ncbi:heavy-metal-associated domain-containing protein [Streptomyces coelicoflavus]|uniref:heavy-metal-associated domain-containing protein n=1 Tax=Streptomyces coelicoflavus TaxID=285562 RepID=UPI00024760EF|nr:heavy-metal-associated domain-containing protein [Streptomyces coelicoflavus]EHN74734.1 putative metal associated protein [Streptomyces coelicoflavus ZG0656]MZE47734.1 transporter [Streptomyces sp. SID5477]
MARIGYLVTGMTCEHCAASVTEEVSQVPGVTDVHVDVSAGSVAVDGTGLDDASLRAAIEEAGYQVTALVLA